MRMASSRAIRLQASNVIAGFGMNAVAISSRLVPPPLGAESESARGLASCYRIGQGAAFNPSRH